MNEVDVVMEETPLIVNQEENDDYILKVGMKVNNEKEAYQLYNDYAVRKGFSVRKGTYRYVKSGLIRARTFLCSKAGYREDASPLEEKKVNRLETRTNCKARVVFTVNDGLWEITALDLEHNHELATDEERQFLRSGRRIQSALVHVKNSTVDAGIRPKNRYYYLAKEAGGPENIGFTKRADCHDYSHTKMLNLIKAGDGQSVINYFEEKQVEDPTFFYSVQVDGENRMKNFFWRDGRSRLDYDCFGDVVMFDTTYRTNKNTTVCAPFVGINHHWKNVFFGCAFLLDETTDSFVWLFETFLESMGNRQPATIFTDQCQALSNAITRVFPETRHRLCLWHISKKATHKLGSHYADPEFKSLFNRCLYGCHDILEFEATWNDMIQKFNLGENEWLKTLYKLREKWCPTFSLDTFSGRVRPTQGSESTNNVFHQMSTKTMNLIEFVHQYEEQANKMRLDELEEDFRCKQGAPRRIAESEILKHAAEVYTIKMFKVFQDEFLNSLGVRMNLVGSYGAISTYQLIQTSHKMSHIVQFNSFDCTVTCSCKMFESMGMLCRHCLRVLDMQNIIQIPTQYISRRWTKEAKRRSSLNDCDEAARNSANSSKTVRLSKLLHLAYNIMHRSSETVEGTEVAEKNLARTIEQLDQIEKQLASSNVVSNLDEGEGADTIIVCDETQVLEHSPSLDEAGVLDPPCARQKGETNARLKNSSEKKRKKKASKGPTTSHTPPPNMFGQNNQPPTFASTSGLFNTPQNLTHFTPSMHPVNANFRNQLCSIVGVPTTDVCTTPPPPNFQSASMLQSSDPTPHLSQASSTGSNVKLMYPWFGTTPPK